MTPPATPPAVPPLPLPTADREGCERLAADLRAAGFTADGVRSAWGADNDDAVGRGVRGPATMLSRWVNTALWR